MMLISTKCNFLSGPANKVGGGPYPFTVRWRQLSHTQSLRGHRESLKGTLKLSHIYINASINNHMCIFDSLDPKTITSDQIEGWCAD